MSTTPDRLADTTTVRLWRDIASAAYISPAAQYLLDELALEYQREQIAAAQSEEAFEEDIRTYQGKQ